MTAIEDFLFDRDISRDWHMQHSERVALLHAVNRAQPDVSIEIGTFLCGSLRPISRYSRHVYTFDIDPAMNRQGHEFPNVTFRTGDSAVLLQPLIDQINLGDAELNFVLSDGSHSEAGVEADIIQIIRYVPKTRPTIILMHDSSNPDVRRGITKAPWSSSPYVHMVDLDYVPGMLYDRDDIRGQIWGGFAAAIMLPHKRDGHVPVQSSFDFSLRSLMHESARMLVDGS